MHATWLLFGYRGMVLRVVENTVAPNVTPWTDGRTPRLYIFSKKDQLVPWELVWKHGEASKEAGVLNVLREVFEDTPHVAHARADPARYWGAIQRVWKDAA